MKKLKSILSTIYYYIVLYITFPVALSFIVIFCFTLFCNNTVKTATLCGFIISGTVHLYIYFLQPAYYLKHKISITEKRLEQLSSERDQLISEGVSNPTNTKEPNYLSIGKLQRKYKIGYNLASKIYNDLISIGYIEIDDPDKSAILLIDSEIVWNYIENTYSLLSNSQPLQAETTTTVSPNYDYMEGHEFEHFCAEILEKNGFVNVKVTQGSGDDGIDVLAEKDDITYGIQCKCYSSNIGNSAIQQAYSGIQMYKCDIGVVLTNRYFTESAKKTAQATKIKLWDRDKLDNLIKNAGITSSIDTDTTPSITEISDSSSTLNNMIYTDPEYFAESSDTNNTITYKPIHKEVVKKKKSILSFIALIISMFGFGFISSIGALLGCIDLIKGKNDGKDHSRSVVAIIAFFGWIFLYLYSMVA